jgi:hypothetical protein
MAMTHGVDLRSDAAPSHSLYALFGLSLILAAASSAPQAVAQDREDVDLAWDAPDDCPDRAWVLRSIAARLNGAAAQPRAAISASGRIERRASDYALTLRTEQGERQLNAASCEELAGSAALILAFIVDPQHTPEPAAVAAPPPETPAPAGDAAAAADEKAAEIEATASGPTLALTGYARAEWTVDVGMMAHAATGPGISIGLTLVDTSMELSAAFLLNNSVSYVAAGGEGASSLAHLSAFMAQLGLCQRVLRGPDLGICVLGEHMRMTADPADALASRSTHSAPVWSVLAAARAAVPIGTRFAWVVELGIGVPLLGARFRVDGIGVIHETGDVVGRLRTGLRLSF